MSNIIKFYRHGETEWNRDGRLQGWENSTLTATGRAQAKKVDWQPDLVFCSDLERAYETAQFMFPHAAIQTSPHLREIYLGEWQGRFITDLQQEESYVCYTETPHVFQPTTQESFQQVTKRMLEMYEQLEQLPYERIAVVSHGVAIACLTIALEGRPLSELWQHMLGGCESVTFCSLKV